MAFLNQEKKDSPLDSHPVQKNRGVRAFEKMLPSLVKRNPDPVQELKLIHRIVNGPRIARGRRGATPIKGHFREIFSPDGPSGTYEPSRVVIVGKGVKKVIYRAPNQNVNAMMEWLGEEYLSAFQSAQTAEEKLRALSFFNVWTSLIHPFADGNGLALASFNALYLARMGFNVPQRSFKKRPDYIGEAHLGNHHSLLQEFAFIYTPQKNPDSLALDTEALELRIGQGIQRGVARASKEDSDFYDLRAAWFMMILDEHCGTRFGMAKLYKEMAAAKNTRKQPVRFLE